MWSSRHNHPEDYVCYGNWTNAWLTHHPSHVELSDLWVQCSFFTVLIRRNFTESYYNQIITNKTAYYTICMPIYLGLVLTGCEKTRLHSPVIQEVCLHLGRFFQIRDDYLDVFADPSVLGKVDWWNETWLCRKELIFRRESALGWFSRHFPCVQRKRRKN